MTERVKRGSKRTLVVSNGNNIPVHSVEFRSGNYTHLIHSVKRVVQVYKKRLDDTYSFKFYSGWVGMEAGDAAAAGRPYVHVSKLGMNDTTLSYAQRFGAAESNRLVKLFWMVDNDWIVTLLEDDRRSCYHGGRIRDIYRSNWS